MLYLPLAIIFVLSVLLLANAETLTLNDERVKEALEVRPSFPSLSPSPNFALYLLPVRYEGAQTHL